MSLLMQALRKAERARIHHGPDDASPADIAPAQGDGRPSSSVRQEAWDLEPLVPGRNAATPDDPDVPVVAAQEAAHDPVPPQARHEAAPRPAPDDYEPVTEAWHMPKYHAMPAPKAADQSRVRIASLSGALALLLVAFGAFYWYGVSGPGPGSKLPMVPMPGAPGSAVSAGAMNAAPPIATVPADPAPQAGMADMAADAPVAPQPEYAAIAPAAPSAGHAPAPATRPPTDITIPTPEQLAAIPDPVIRAEAMRDAAERAARLATTQDMAPAASAPSPAEPRQSAAAPTSTAPTAARRSNRPERTASSAGASGMVTTVGDSGEVRFVRGTTSASIAPAVQNGYAALAAGDVATARQQYDLALLQEPNNRDALLGAAAVAMREQNGAQATANYLRLLELDPNDPEALAGLASLRPGDLADTETRLKGILRKHPDSGPVQFAMGNLYARQGRWSEAQQAYFRAYNAMPGSADYAFNLAIGLDRLNQPRLAQTYYRRALELAQAAPAAFDANAVHQRLQELEAPSR